MILSHKRRTHFTLILILVLGITLRLTNINWDQNQHLHPDERFLTLVSLDTSIPKPFTQYFNPSHSTLNPRNVGYDFYVYGTFPLTINKLIATSLDNDSYSLLTLQGRALSAIFDSISILLVFLLTQLLFSKNSHKERIGLWSAFLYATMVTPIQLAHFFTTDIFLSTFSFASITACVYFHKKRRLSALFISALFLGFALGSKINAVFIFPLCISLIALQPNTTIRDQLSQIFSKKSLKIISHLLLFIAVSYVSLRAADPYLFKSSNLFNPTIDPRFIQNIKELKRWEDPDAMFPPAIQWIGTKPLIYSAKNMILLGIGVPISLMIAVGVANLFKQKHQSALIPTVFIWVLAVYVYQSSQFAKALRYFVLIYPFLAILGGLGATKVMSYSKGKGAQKIATPIVFGLLASWTALFMSIYIKPHTRITASEWIYENIPPNTHIALEHWDDPLPLHLENYPSNTITGTQMPIFSQDNQEKWSEINRILNSTDYYVLTSNRGWGSIPKVPERFPIMSQFYNDLFSEKTNFTKVAEFTSYPSLEYLGIPIELKDDWADETFTVYDHPKVIIFKKNE